MIQQEIWKIIDGTDSRYSVSNYGNVRSNGFFDSLKRWHPKRYLTPQENGNGYLFVKFGRSYKSEYVHRLVCKYFLGLKEDLHVNHKDGNKSNNNYSNLEAVTRSQNDLHKKRNLEWHRYPIVDLETGIFYSNAKELFEVFGHTKKWKYPMWKSFIQNKRLINSNKRFVRL
jgi:hypothetical protein